MNTEKLMSFKEHGKESNEQECTRALFNDLFYPFNVKPTCGLFKSRLKKGAGTTQSLVFLANNIKHNALKGIFAQIVL